ncbi:DUF485 domain-containing protein [Embleya scabrispora]|uniref:DUF485 domain-containing protein n=1 Tax=Embleya scabrispora TaxID=159449 RepID=UPI0003A57E9B|nr:DUF485 domain-containing protein [Embleya scabrispora]
MTTSSYRPTPTRGVPFGDPEPDSRADIYLRVQASPEFQEIRRRYRDFVFPMSLAFLAWYLLYVFASTFARGFMAHRILGAFNIALAFGLLQFASTFLITWSYARNARGKRDRSALNLRWETQEMFR